jgi:hypothetical protein
MSNKRKIAVADMNARIQDKTRAALRFIKKTSRRHIPQPTLRYGGEGGDSTYERAVQETHNLTTWPPNYMIPAITKRNEDRDSECTVRMVK